MGHTALHLLEENGLSPNAHAASIRSRDWGDIRVSPFLYYLRRRVGIMPLLDIAKAKTIGSALHTALEAHLTGRSPADLVHNRLATRLDAIRAVLSSPSAIPRGPEAQRLILDRERQHWMMGLTFALAALNYRSDLQPALVNGFAPYLTRNTRVLCCERVFEAPNPLSSRVPLRIRVDTLLYREDTNTITLPDFKSTSTPLKIKAELLQFDFQPALYLYVLDSLAKTGELQAAFDLPRDARVTDIIHLLIRTPSIKFSGEDRNFTLDTSPFKSGPRKGQPRNERKYYGEPTLENYYQRVHDWLTADGRYREDRLSTADDPRINVSFTPITRALDDRGLMDFMARLRIINEYATARPIPSAFFRDTSNQYGRKSLSPYHPLHLASVSLWPSIMRQNELTIRLTEDEDDADHTDSDDE